MKPDLNTQGIKNRPSLKEIDERLMTIDDFL